MTTRSVPATPDGAEVITVTPDLASEWLVTNTHNRNLRFRAINRYAADMVANDWRWTGDPIRFSRDGVLLDGQHRLQALIDADVSLPFLVVRGLDPEAQENIDGGVPRRFHDVLRLRGEEHPTALASITRLATQWDAGIRRGLSGTGATNAQMLRTLDAHPELRDATRHELRAVADRVGGMGHSLVGFCWWLFDAVDTEDAEHFFRRLGQDVGHVKGEPIYELRRTMADRQRADKSARVFATVVTIKAWNAYRAGETVSMYRWRAGGANPETFPEPK